MLTGSDSFSFDRARLLVCLNEIYDGHETILQSSSTPKPPDLTSGRLKSKATLLRCWFEEEDLHLRFHTSEGEEFSIGLPKRWLVPQEPYELEPEFDLEKSIAVGVLFLMDESMVSVNASQLDGYLFP
jgi:hypothetical protein